jgi:hypothetical protein
MTILKDPTFKILPGTPASFLASEEVADNRLRSRAAMCLHVIITAALCNYPAVIAAIENKGTDFSYLATMAAEISECHEAYARVARSESKDMAADIALYLKISARTAKFTEELGVKLVSIAFDTQLTGCNGTQDIDEKILFPLRSLGYTATSA